MSRRRLFVVCVVEGHGEVTAVPALLHKLTACIDNTVDLRVLDPIRRSRSKIVQAGELEKDIQDAAIQLAAAGAIERGCVLVLLDADDDCAATQGPALLERAKVARPDIKIEIVFAVREFESWILASSRSLAAQQQMTTALDSMPDIESVRDAKGALKERLPQRRYAPTVDQARLVRKIDIEEARQTQSFDRLFRKWQELLKAI